MLRITLVVVILMSISIMYCNGSSLEEVETMMEVLKMEEGWRLFANAVATSDLQYELLLASSVAATVFAAQDSLVYALDMMSDSATYLSTLRYHVVPNQRHTFLQLQNLSSSFLDTLLPQYSILIGKTMVQFDNSSPAVLVDGVRVSAPDLYLGSTIAVHGIDGILLAGLNMNQELFDARHIPPPLPPPPRINRSESVPPLAVFGDQILPPDPPMPMFPYFDSDDNWIWDSNYNKNNSEGPDPDPAPAAGAVSVTDDDNDGNNNINLPAIASIGT